MDVMPLLLLVAGSAAVAAAARRTPVPPPLVLVAVGLAVSYLPGVPPYALDPHIVLPLILPPLLYTAAVESSYLDLRAQLRPVALLSVGYVLFATLAVGWVLYLLVPGLPLTAALVFGAVVAPPDAVAATAVARRVGLPSRITTILQGESLFNDATAITAFRVAVAASVGEGVSWAGGVGEFLLAAVGGVAVGLVLMAPLHWLRTHVKETLLQNTLSLLIPFVAYGVAEQVHASGVIAVVVVALYLGHRAWEVDFATRLQESAVWGMVAVRPGVGRVRPDRTPAALRHARARGPRGQLLRLVRRGRLRGGRRRAVPLGYLAVWLPYLVSARIRARERRPGWKAPFVISWAGMRGVVSLAIAFSIPVTAEGEDFPHRYLLLFLTFTTVIGTLVVQGLTLPPLIRMLRLPGRDAQAETLAEANAQAQASRVAEERLDALLADERNALPAPLADRLRSVLERRRNAVWERLGQVNPVTGESVDDTYRRLSREMIGAEREVFVKLRDGRYIDDEMLRTLLRRLDLEEAAAYRETE
ncbi:Na+/H+ antiporter OS=Streptomyces tendae OX=1932 GN=F3L20_05735 PE=3 SV=1 [Streptomyces tendae]